MSIILRWINNSYLHWISLDLFGLVALADISAVARRTALTGTSNLADALILCPGFHRQQDAPDLSGGDYPWCAAMSTGYCFRVENEGTILYMQKVGRTGHLTNLVVSHGEADVTSQLPDMACLGAIILAILTAVFLYLLRDPFGLLFLGLLMLARLVNVFVIRRRAVEGWKGQPEPNQKSDLIVLLSQDRWIRLKGAVDDVKAVTSGQWLREPTVVESTCVAFATLLVYLNVALGANATQAGKVVLVVLVCSSAALLGLSNEYTKSLRMYGRSIVAEGAPKRYTRRLVLTEELVKDTRRGDWAIDLGMAKPGDVEKWLSTGDRREDSSDKRSKDKTT